MSPTVGAAALARGEIWLVDLGDPIGHEAAWRRPALVVSDPRLAAVGLAVVLPITRTRRGYATNVELDGALPVISYVQCEQIRTISTDRAVEVLGRVSPVDLARVDQVLRYLLRL